MIQKLYFEPAWERTISEQHRTQITNIFKQIKIEKVVHGTATYLWHAYNHQGNLLVTVLLHNSSDKAIHFKHKLVRCLSGEEEIAVQTFSIPSEMPPYTSMPWTFIFLKERIRDDVDTGMIHIIVENDFC